MALLDEVRFALTRIDSSLGTSVETEFQRYIDAAILDLTETTDIKTFTAENADALQREAVIAYALYSFEKDTTRKDKYKDYYSKGRHIDSYLHCDSKRKHKACG